jgi:hypothetical protein
MAELGIVHFLAIVVAPRTTNNMPIILRRQIERK